MLIVSVVLQAHRERKVASGQPSLPPRDRCTSDWMTVRPHLTVSVSRKDHAPMFANFGARLRKSVTLLLLVALAALAAVPGVSAHTFSDAPPALDVPPYNVLLFTTFATGNQVYICASRENDPNSYTWTFKAPEALLWDDLGRQIGMHYAGPSWEGQDGSKIVGKVVARADAPTPDAIPWLLLEATPQSGPGMFSNVTYIQRIDTVGGLAPVDGCDQATAGSERGVEYTAIYAFYHGAVAEQ